MSRHNDDVKAIVETLFAEESKGAIWVSQEELQLMLQLGFLNKSDMLYIGIFCRCREDGKTLMHCPEYGTLRSKRLTKLIT